VKPPLATTQMSALSWANVIPLGLFGSAALLLARSQVRLQHFHDLLRLGCWGHASMLSPADRIAVVLAVSNRRVCPCPAG
jgi:hypothetical protein